MADAHGPAAYVEADVLAIRACIAGTANEGQQKRAMDWIISQASRYYDLSYRPGDPGATNFHEGRRYVGAQIVKMTRPETLDAARKTKRGKPEAT